MIGMLCAADSTPSDNSLSPLMDDAKADDDIIITSPNKSRTTEDLFAMIHRCVNVCVAVARRSSSSVHLLSLCLFLDRRERSWAEKIQET